MFRSESKFASLGLFGSVLGVLIWVGVMPRSAHGGGLESVPDFAPDSSTAWTSDRPASDDFLPPPSGAGPVMSDKARPYVPNGQGQPTYRVADLNNPILKPWVIERMRKANEEVLAGKVPFMHERGAGRQAFPG
jgi:hypothetical protein